LKDPIVRLENALLAVNFLNKDERYEAYITICSRIKEAIREDQIGGGMAGIYNPSITQRLNGLVEKVQNDVKVEQMLFPDV
jgi:TPP-dependent pyruvate/acetoin dehydrogenase alpha subunit